MVAASPKTATALALELERLGFSDDEDSMEDAVALRPEILKGVLKEIGEALRDRDD